MADGALETTRTAGKARRSSDGIHLPSAIASTAHLDTRDPDEPKS